MDSQQDKPLLHNTDGLAGETPADQQTQELSLPSCNCPGVDKDDTIELQTGSTIKAYQHKLCGGLYRKPEKKQHTKKGEPSNGST
jgi:hypothetical protein